MNDFLFSPDGGGLITNAAPLSEQVQAHAALPEAFGAGSHSSLPRVLHFSIFLLWHSAALEASFPSCPSRPRFRPKISPRRLPPRNSLPAVAQTSAPASRRPVKIFPAGRSPTEWAGSCTSIERKYADGADPPRGTCVGAH